MSGRVLALDYGTKRVGYATGYFSLKIALPGGFFLNRGVDSLVKDLVAFIAKEGFKSVVVGLPLSMLGEKFEKPILADVRYFSEILRDALRVKGLEVQIYFFEEQLSSFEADEFLFDLRKRGGGNLNLDSNRDSLAATVILQRFFDAL